MKCFITKTLLATALTLAFAAHAASDTIRLVVSQPASLKLAVSGQSVNSGCVTAVNGTTFCLPSKPSTTAVAESSSSAAQPYAVYTIDAQGFDAQTVADLFNKSGLYGVVEVDAKVAAKPVSVIDFATATTISNTAPQVNDTHFAANQENKIGRAHV